MPFSKFGRKSIEGLAQAMRAVEGGSRRSISKMDGLRSLMSTRWTWDRAGTKVIKRLLETQP
jgi:hypothetical protein